jgi:hypothetical protein
MAEATWLANHQACRLPAQIATAAPNANGGASLAAVAHPNNDSYDLPGLLQGAAA